MVVVRLLVDEFAALVDVEATELAAPEELDDATEVDTVVTLEDDDALVEGVEVEAEEVVGAVLDTVEADVIEADVIEAEVVEADVIEAEELALLE